jgi:5-methylcytosine-specific restriction enzyme A
MNLLLRHYVEKATGRIPANAPHRASGWAKLEKEVLAEHPEGCVVCNSRVGLNVHHIQPFHLFPALELVKSNLIVLCRIHHFWWGHLGSWKSYNIHVVDDAQIWNGKIKSRP